jgi:hypothetical protein
MERREIVDLLLEKAGQSSICPACGRQMKWTASSRYKCDGDHSIYLKGMRLDDEFIRILPAGSDDPDDSYLTLLRGKERVGGTVWNNDLLLWDALWYMIPDKLDALPELHVWVNPRLAG